MFWFLILPLAAVVGAGLPDAGTGLARSALVGRTLGLLGLLGAGFAAAVVATPVPSGLIAYAGFVPLLRGVRQLGSGRFRPDPGAGGAAEAGSWRAHTRETLGRGGDVLAIAVALFPTHTGEEIGACSAAIAAGALLAGLARRPIVRGLSPLCLVAVGAYVLIEGGAFNWLLSPLLGNTSPR